MRICVRMRDKHKERKEKRRKEKKNKGRRETKQSWDQKEKKRLVVSSKQATSKKEKHTNMPSLSFSLASHSSFSSVFLVCVER